MEISLFNAILGCTLVIVLCKWTFLVNEKPQSEARVLLKCRNAASFYDSVIPLKLSKFVLFAKLADVAMTIWDAAFDIFFLRFSQPTKVYKIY